MRRIDTATKAVDLFGAGKHGFKDGDPALAILATKLNAAFFNSVQEELSRAIEGAGLTLAPADNTQLLAAIIALARGVLPKRSFAANDYIRIPDVPGGLIIQFGAVASVAGAATPITFPVVFPAAMIARGAFANGAVGAGHFCTVISSADNKVGMQIETWINNATRAAAGLTAWWIAIGY